MLGQFTTQGMSRLTAAGLISKVDDAVQALADVNAVHLVDYSGSEDGFSLGNPTGESPKVGRELNLFRSAVSQIDTGDTKVLLDPSSIRLKLAADLPTLVGEMLGHLDRLGEIDSELETISDEMAILELLSPLGLDLDLLSGYDSIVSFVGTIKDVAIAKAAAAGAGEAFISEGKPNVVAVFSKKEFTSAVQSSLDDGGFTALMVPEGSGTISSRLQQLSDNTDSLSSERNNLQAELDDWAQNNGTTLLGGIELLERDLTIANGAVHLAVSEHAFVIDGWVESIQEPEIREALADTCLHVDIEKYKVVPGGGGHGHHDESAELPPIKFAERHASKPFELVVDMMGRPAYRKVDPTLFMFITYPLFFGLMLGDMLYGIGTLALAYALYQKIGHTDQGFLASKLLMYIGLSTVLFGYIFGEFAGFEILPHYACDAVATHGMSEAVATGCHWSPSHAPAWASWPSYLYPHGGEIHWTTNDMSLFSFMGVSHGLPFGLSLGFPFHRVSSDLMNLILLSIYIGVAHILLGLFIGFRDVMVVGDSHGNRGFVTAFFDKGSWIAITVGGFLLAYAYMVIGSGSHSGEGYLDFLGTMMTFGGTVLAIGIFMLFYATWKYHGYPMGISAILSLIEPFGIISNVISYMRIALVGLVGVKIAELGNVLFYGDAHEGTGMLGAIETMAHHGVEGPVAWAVFIPFILAIVVKLFGKRLPQELSGFNMWIGVGMTGLFGLFFTGAEYLDLALVLLVSAVFTAIIMRKNEFAVVKVATTFFMCSFFVGALVGGGSYSVMIMFFAWLGIQAFAWVLGVFSPNIHTARLHLVEWMKQFYEVAGDVFAPFGFNPRYVEVE
jgi:V/A-type H+/Na+-transporting ATPase subunit I